jgi:hypothetical protein
LQTDAGADSAGPAPRCLTPVRRHQVEDGARRESGGHLNHGVGKAAVLVAQAREVMGALADAGTKPFRRSCAVAAAERVMMGMPSRLAGDCNEGPGAGIVASTPSPWLNGAISATL